MMLLRLNSWFCVEADAVRTISCVLLLQYDKAEMWRNLLSIVIQELTNAEEREAVLNGDGSSSETESETDWETQQRRLLRATADYIQARQDLYSSCEALLRIGREYFWEAPSSCHESVLGGYSMSRHKPVWVDFALVTCLHDDQELMGRLEDRIQDVPTSVTASPCTNDIENLRSSAVRHVGRSDAVTPIVQAAVRGEVNLLRPKSGATDDDRNGTDSLLRLSYKFMNAFYNTMLDNVPAASKYFAGLTNRSAEATNSTAVLEECESIYDVSERKANVDGRPAKVMGHNTELDEGDGRVSPSYESFDRNMDESPLLHTRPSYVARRIAVPANELSYRSGTADDRTTHINHNRNNHVNDNNSSERGDVAGDNLSAASAYDSSQYSKSGVTDDSAFNRETQMSMALVSMPSDLETETRLDAGSSGEHPQRPHARLSPRQAANSRSAALVHKKVTRASRSAKVVPTAGSAMVLDTVPPELVNSTDFACSVGVLPQFRNSAEDA
eukprot:Lankesteria_metandrocarpae@DN3648_c0_g1_i2.p1